MSIGVGDATSINAKIKQSVTIEMEFLSHFNYKFSNDVTLEIKIISPY